MVNGYRRLMSTRGDWVDRDTPVLLTPDVRDWVKMRDPFYMVLSLLEALQSYAFYVNERGSRSR